MVIWGSLRGADGSGVWAVTKAPRAPPAPTLTDTKDLPYLFLLSISAARQDD